MRSDLLVALPAILITVVLNGSAQLFLRMGLRETDLGELITNRRLADVVSAVFSPWTLAGLAAYAISVVLWMMVLSKVPASLAYPFISIAFVVVVFGGAVFLGESLSSRKLLGTLTVIIGVVIVARS